MAFADDRKTVLASGRTAEEAFAKAQKKQPETLIITHLPEEDEIPNDDLLAAMRETDEMERKGGLKFHTTLKAMLTALE